MAADFGTFSKGFHVVSKRKDVSWVAKGVFQAILNRMGDKDMCWPSYATLADDCGISRRTAIRAVEELRKARMIRVSKRDSSTNEYWCQSVTGDNLSPVTNEHQIWCDPDTSAGADLSPETEPIEQIKEKRTISRAKPAKQPKSSKSKKGQKRRVRDDPVWNVVQELFYPDGVPAGLQTSVGGIVRDLRELKATPDIIRTAYRAHKAAWPDMTCTARSLVKHWAEFRNGSATERKWKDHQARLERQRRKDHDATGV